MADGSIFLQRAKNLFFIALGTLALSFATASFLIPFELVAGGISGAAIAIGSFFEDSVRYTEVVIAMLTWAAFFSGLIFLGKSFALKTLLSSALYPLFISLFIERGASDFLLSLFDFKGGMLLAALLGGAIVGFGCALSFKGGGSTGGVDVLSLIICKKNLFVNPAKCRGRKPEQLKTRLLFLRNTGRRQGFRGRSSTPPCA